MTRTTLCQVWLAAWLLTTAAVATETTPTELPRQPTPQWTTQLQAGRFYIHADFELSEDQSLLSELSSMSSSVMEILKLPQTDQPIHVVLFRNAREYGRYLKNYYPTVPERRALFIQGRGPGMVFAHWHSDIHTDIRHEVVHGLLNDQARPLPLWLDEGLAEYFEVAAEDRLADNPHLSEICHELDRGSVPALEDLEAVGTIEQLDGSQYRDSWAWVHFMLHRSPQTRQQLVTQLASYRSAKPIVPLSRSIAAGIPNWQAEFAAHFRALRKDSHAGK